MNKLTILSLNKINLRLLSIFLLCFSVILCTPNNLYSAGIPSEDIVIASVSSTSSLKTIVGNGQRAGQSFLSTADYSLTKVSIKGMTTESTTNITVQIRTNDTGVPSDTVLGSTNVSVEVNNAWYDAVFNPTLSLETDKTYWITVEGTFGGSNTFWWFEDWGIDTYSPGYMAYDDGTGWQSDPNTDFGFIAYAGAPPDITEPIVSNVTSSFGKDTDNSYYTGSLVRITVEEENGEDDLSGCLTISSSSQSYSSGRQDLTDGLFDYYYDWDTTGLGAATDYEVNVALWDSSNNNDTDGITGTSPDLQITLIEPTPNEVLVEADDQVERTTDTIINVEVRLVISDGPGWIVIYNQADDDTPDIPRGWTHVSDGINFNTVVPIETNTTGNFNVSLYAILHRDLGVIDTYEFPGVDVPVNITSPDTSVLFNFTRSGGSGAGNPFLTLNEFKIINGDINYFIFLGIMIIGVILRRMRRIANK